MTHPKKHQHRYPMRDVATAGRYQGTIIPAPGDWYTSMWGIGDGGLGHYTGVDMDAPTGQENESAESNEAAAPTSTGAGPAMGAV